MWLVEHDTGDEMLLTFFITNPSCTNRHENTKGCTGSNFFFNASVTKETRKEDIKDDRHGQKRNTTGT